MQKGNRLSLKLLPETEGAKGARAVFRTALRRIKLWAAFPDAYIFWFPGAFSRGMMELRKKRYHAVFSTSPPNTCHLLGAALAAAADLPWVADFRDPWTQNVHRMASVTPARFRVERRCEVGLIRRASALVTVSEALVEDLRNLHGDRKGGIHCITGGFDSEYRIMDIRPDPSRLIITHAGSLYGLRPNPADLLEAVDELVLEGAIEKERILVRFYGPHVPGLRELRDALAHPELVEINGVVAREEALERLAGSSLAVVIQWDNPYYDKIYGGKIFELMGLGRPVLALTSHGSLLARLVERCGLGRVCATKAEIKEALLAWNGELRAYGCVRPNVKEEELEAYRWENLAGRLAAVLDRISAPVA